VLRTLPFVGTVAAAGETTLVSKRIGAPFMLRRIAVSFAPGCEGLVQLRFFLGMDPSSTASGYPSGTNLLQDLGQVDYVIGDDRRIVLEREVDVDWYGAYLKVHATNADAFEHTVDVTMTIDLA